MTVSSDSACNKPADSSVWWSSSTNNPLARTCTFEILRSIGSWPCFFSWSIAFNSLMVPVGLTLTVRSTPSKVFTLSSQDMAAMASWECCFWWFFGSQSSNPEILVVWRWWGDDFLLVIWKILHLDKKRKLVGGKSVTLYAEDVGHGLSWTWDLSWWSGVDCRVLQASEPCVYIYIIWVFPTKNRGVSPQNGWWK